MIKCTETVSLLCNGLAGMIQKISKHPVQVTTGMEIVQNTWEFYLTLSRPGSIWEYAVWELSSELAKLLKYQEFINLIIMLT